VGARLYLPAEWAADPARRERAGVPEDVVFKTKPELGIDILTDLLAANAPPPWVTGDEAYGRDPALRVWCEDRGVGYVLGVRADQALGFVPRRRGTGPPAGQDPKETEPTTGPGSPPPAPATTCSSAAT
jgi:SRSO17 transposase